jgi:NhaP-type Na+/H+ and K+/H+ antiporter
VILTQSSRLRGSNVWSALGFVLNGLVFMLIGLELPVIVSQLGGISLGEAIGYGALITAVLVVTRVLCTVGASYFTVFISRYITTADSRPGLRGPLIIGWAGMRGVVSLAAALSVPLHLNNGAPFPQRNLILFITFMVILLTLVVQGLTLPMVIKWLHFEDPDHYLPANEQDVQIRRQLATESAKYLQNNHAEAIAGNQALLQLKTKLEDDSLTPNDEGETRHGVYCTVYRDLLNMQREFLNELNKKPETSEEVIRKYHGLIDLEEERIRVKYEGLE